MKILNMKLSSGSGSLKAFFDLETSEAITMKGFKVAEGKNGLFVGVPSDQDKNDKTKYWDRVLVPKELKAELNDLALQEYSKLTES